MTYKYRVTKDNIGHNHEVIELFPLKKGNPKDEHFIVENGNWQKFINYLRKSENRLK